MKRGSELLFPCICLSRVFENLLSGLASSPGAWISHRVLLGGWPFYPEKAACVRSRKRVISFLIHLGKLNLLVLTGKHRGAKGTLNTNLFSGANCQF